MTAEGGSVGIGGAGSPGVPSESSSFSNAAGTFTTTIGGVGALGLGPVGTHGTSLLAIRNTEIDLGGGDDQLVLRLETKGFGPKRVVIDGNLFDGGEGVDQIMFGQGLPAEVSVFVDVGAETVRFGRPGAPANVLTGFEQFRGSGNDDRFRDGAGDQVYRGGGGDDLFAFFARNQGHDRILDLDEGDVVALRGFGGRLNSFAKLLALAEEVDNGVLITTGAASSVWLGGLSIADLKADMFSF